MTIHNKVIVIGSGIMGSGIAQVIGQSKINVTIVDTNDSAINLSKKNVQISLNKLVKKNKITEEEGRYIIEKKIHWSQNLLNELNSNKFDIAIEAIPEEFILKKKIIDIFNDCYSISKDMIYASNTSSISITKMAREFHTPSNFIGMHFMNPVPIMKLVELIPALQTSSNTIENVEKFAKFLGKQTVISKDFAGFIANRILIPMINEAFYALMEGLSSAEDIDKSMMLGCNHPMGPLALADFIGLDTCLYVINILHQELGDNKYRACPLLKQYVSAGWLGKKSKRGVYIYN